MICVAPDVGGTERARALGKLFGVGLAIVDKETKTWSVFSNECYRRCQG